MTRRTKQRWPHADILVAYLKDYAKPQEDAGNIKYNTTVASIDRAHLPCNVEGEAGAESGSADHAGFLVHIHPTGTEQSAAKPLSCKVVVVASGLSKPHIPKSVQGIEHAMGYEELPVDGEPFEGKNKNIKCANQHSSWQPGTRNVLAVCPSRRPL